MTIVDGREGLRPINIVTAPHPGFATDLQPIAMVLATGAAGKSYIRERVFDARFALADELRAMGANVTVRGDAAIIEGPTQLRGTTVTAHDIRAGAALVLAGLSAQGTTTVANARMINRGHSALAARLSALGADIQQT